jgi:hypothetical protein
MGYNSGKHWHRVWPLTFDKYGHLSEATDRPGQGPVLVILMSPFGYRLSLVGHPSRQETELLARNSGRGLGAA